MDDRLPCEPSGELLYARSVEPNEFWVALLEKCFAKLYGSYEALISGFADSALRDLTGGCPVRLSLREVLAAHDSAPNAAATVPAGVATALASGVATALASGVATALASGAGAGAGAAGAAAGSSGAAVGTSAAASSANGRAPRTLGALWAALGQWHREGSPIGCAYSLGAAQGTGDGGRPEVASAEGILRGHAYSVERLEEVAGRRLLRLRNPWGYGEWTGAWADGAREWTPELLRTLEYAFEEDGTFWMELSDFVAQFTTVYTCRLFDGWQRLCTQGVWVGDAAAGSMRLPGWRHNPCVLLRLPQPAPLFAMLSQPDPRLHAATHPSLDATPNVTPNARYPSADPSATAPPPIGFALLPTVALRPSGTVRTSEMALRGAPLRAERDVSCASEVELPAGEYVLVPFTLEPGHHGHWTAEVRVGGECELIPMPSVASVLERAQIERAQRGSLTAETAATAAPAVDKAKATLARLKLDTTEEEEDDDDDGWSVAGSEPEDERTRTLERHAAAHATAAATGQSFASALTTSLGAALGVNGGEASLSRRERKERRRATLAAARRQHKHMAAQRQQLLDGGGWSRELASLDDASSVLALRLQSARLGEPPPLAAASSSRLSTHPPPADTRPLAILRPRSAEVLPTIPPRALSSPLPSPQASLLSSRARDGAPWPTRRAAPPSTRRPYMTTATTGTTTAEDEHDYDEDDEDGTSAAAAAAALVAPTGRRLAPADPYAAARAALARASTVGVPRTAAAIRREHTARLVRSAAARVLQGAPPPASTAASTAASTSYRPDVAGNVAASWGSGRASAKSGRAAVGHEDPRIRTLLAAQAAVLLSIESSKRVANAGANGAPGGGSWRQAVLEAQRRRDEVLDRLLAAHMPAPPWH